MLDYKLTVTVRQLGDFSAQEECAVARLAINLKLFPLSDPEHKMFWKSKTGSMFKVCLFPVRMVLYHFNRYLLGLVSTYVCTYHRTEEFIIALANYVVSQGVQITYRPNIFLVTFYNR